MPTYILLTTLTPEGVQTVKNNPQRILEVNKEVEQLGATVKAQWATLGHVDFISVVEAPDEGTMARVSLELGSRGTARYETLVGDPDRRLHRVAVTCATSRQSTLTAIGDGSRSTPVRAGGAPERGRRASRWCPSRCRSPKCRRSSTTSTWTPRAWAS